MSGLHEFDLWMSESEGFASRRERLLEAIEQGSFTDVEQFVRAAWELGFNAGRRAARSHPF